MPTKCSFFFGGSHNGCCAEHDLNYAKTTRVSRKEADDRLFDCVQGAGHPVRAWVMYLGVRAFGWIFYKGGR